MARLVRTISKFFVVLVMLFGNPPVVRLRDLARRPAVALVATARPSAGALAPPGARAQPDLALIRAAGLPSPAGPAGDSERHYIPVKAA
jgi:hypothetical protein